MLSTNSNSERTAEGTIIMNPPTGFDTGDRNSTINYHLKKWAIESGGGRVTDSSTGYDLPNGANRSPDAAWISNDRFTELSQHGTSGFLQGAPDFVIELRSPSDSVVVLQAKMLEYIANGARLGILIDPASRSITKYMPEAEPQTIRNPSEIDGEPVLKGFRMSMQEIFS